MSVGGSFKFRVSSFKFPVILTRLPQEPGLSSCDLSPHFVGVQLHRSRRPIRWLRRDGCDAEARSQEARLHGRLREQSPGAQGSRPDHGPSRRVERWQAENRGFVCVDVVGLFNAVAVSVRKLVEGFAYVSVSSTHNHEGPDSLGLWGVNPFKSGVDKDYMKGVEAAASCRIVGEADKSRRSRRPRRSAPPSRRNCSKTIASPT